MTDKIRIICVFLLGYVLFIGCEKELNTQVGEKGNLKISLTDASAEFDSVNIVFSEISAHIDNEWISVSQEPDTVDLLQWNNGKSIVIGEAEVRSGHYSQIRLIIDDAYVVVAGIKHQMTVPSGAQTGLKFGPEFDITPGMTFELVIDFDASRSVVVTGPKNNPKGYKLKPHIRVVTKAITGSISGTLDKSYDSPVYAYAIIPPSTSGADPDTVTSSIVEAVTNTFTLGFLLEGTYDVTIEDAAGLKHTEPGVQVIIGSNKDIGQVELK